MKHFMTSLLAASFTILSVGAFAQSHNHSLDHKDGHREGESVNYCGNLQLKEKLFAMDPAFKAQYELDRATMELEAQQYMASQQNGAERGGNEIIPIVFHIIHVNGTENISNDQIFDAVEVLNMDFNLLNSDANNVQTTFQGLQGDVGIEFRLATKKPDGSCFNGITRTYSTTSTTGAGGGWNNDQITAVENEHGAFPGDEYLNVYLVANADGAAGYTRLPFSTQWGGASMYNGIVILHTYVGRNGTSNVNRSRALTHEIGHWLNLEHVWGPNNNPGNSSSCNDDDGVDDTPNSIGHTSCALTANTCANEANYWGTTNPITNPVDNVENYMDYSYCSKMFTVQQGQRMISALNGNTGNRDNLSTTNNLNNTGVSLSPTLCVADFTQSRTTICAGQSIDFTDMSYNAATSWNWTFTGGSPASSTVQDPTVTFNTPGTYSVSMQVSDGSSTQTMNQTNLITVLPAVGINGPIVEGFESNTPLPNSEWVLDDQTGGPAWEVSSQAAKTGTYSIKLDNANNPAGHVDDFLSSTIDLSGFTAITLSFEYAYVEKNTSNNERLIVYVSKDCGQTWSLRKQLSGNALPTSNAQNGPWIPTSASHWKYVEVTNILSSYLVDNFRVRFSFESDGGNNIFIDDINISGPVGIDGANEVIQNFEVFPNPTESNTNINFGINNDAQVSIALLDVVGKEIKTITTGSLSAGEHTYQVNTADLSSGIYLVNMLVGDRAYTKRLIVK